MNDYKREKSSVWGFLRVGRQLHIAIGTFFQLKPPLFGICKCICLLLSTQLDKCVVSWNRNDHPYLSGQL